MTSPQPAQAAATSAVRVTADLVPADNMAVVAEMDRESQAVAITNMLTEARGWLAHAVEATDPTSVVAFKAQMATVAEATKQLGLSKEIQADASEMVRRAERGIGTTIKRGQAAGTVAAREDNLRIGQSPKPSVGNSGDRPSPTELVPSNRARQDIYTMADAPDAVFEAALQEAKAEGNLSRANVADKVREQAEPQPKANRRKPLPDTARDAGWELRKAVERLTRLAEDDRFTANKEQVAPHLRSRLTNAIEVCQDLLDRINNN